MIFTYPGPLPRDRLEQIWTPRTGFSTLIQDQAMIRFMTVKQSAMLLMVVH